MKLNLTRMLQTKAMCAVSMLSQLLTMGKRFHGIAGPANIATFEDGGFDETGVSGLVHEIWGLRNCLFLFFKKIGTLIRTLTF